METLIATKDLSDILNLTVEQFYQFKKLLGWQPKEQRVSLQGNTYYLWSERQAKRIDTTLAKLPGNSPEAKLEAARAIYNDRRQKKIAQLDAWQKQKATYGKQFEKEID